ncbi:MAG: SAP domain-containing protein [Syntrophales bacterium]
MKMQEVRETARRWGVDVRVGRTKQEIIRDIQVREGYSPCYRTREQCGEACLWRLDCLAGEKPRRKAP